ncbi:hypothetical protein T03_12191 [Trichinella britovi]|uniref:Uncharacterized protein n=1 Tax=Trichinella britovi TaxID=45882 RepID=A0A0V1C5V1_TRIBR|nr:hypothetical protein T03_6966 [Trichinella britovi]KRY44645.1 hypothetical protein T03_12191 [Trichinella britovi]
MAVCIDNNEIFARFNEIAAQLPNKASYFLSMYIYLKLLLNSESLAYFFRLHLQKTDILSDYDGLKFCYV